MDPIIAKMVPELYLSQKGHQHINMIIRRFATEPKIPYKIPVTGLEKEGTSDGAIRRA